jgi:pyruvate/2-oxoglutarate dehydrogenase complex dihydrolipoamide dehydrogenase (E3) component
VFEPHSQSILLPDDDHNRRLVANAHPPAWTNPVPAGRYNLVVIGAGTAGLVSAIGAASLGARVAIVERHLTGGDCLNFGCVPSKAVIRSARAAAAVQQRNAEFGVAATNVSVDFGAVMERMRRLRADLAPNDSVSRLHRQGVDVFLGAARFAGADRIVVGRQTLRFSRAVIATGARSAVPDIPGLRDAGYLTNETVFSLTERPRHLIVIGAGPIGCELAQAFRRLGADVTIVGRRGGLLPREDADVGDLITRVFVREGIQVIPSGRVLAVERRTGGSHTAVVVETEGGVREMIGDAVLVAIGRTANVDDLDLAAAGVQSTARGVTVNDALQTTNPRIYAAGDVCGAYKFTHAADAMARLVLHNALFFGRKRASALVVPWATYTDPEVAHVGIGATVAASRGDDVVTLTHSLSDNDRAVLDGQTEGFARVHVARRGGRILGATMVAGHAGEMIGEIAVAMQSGLRMSVLGSTIHPYPTQSEAWKRLGDEWNRRRLSPRVRALLNAVLRWRR